MKPKSTPPVDPICLPQDYHSQIIDHQTSKHLLDLTNSDDFDENQAENVEENFVPPESSIVTACKKLCLASWLSLTFIPRLGLGLFNKIKVKLLKVEIEGQYYESQSNLLGVKGRSKSKLGLVFIIFLLLTTPVLGFNIYNQLLTKKGEVLGVTHHALNSATKATADLKTGNLSEASFKLDQAYYGFSQARQELENVDSLSQALIKIAPPGQTARKLLVVGQILAKVGGGVSQSLVNILNQTDTNLSLSDRLDQLISVLNQIWPNLDQAEKLLTQVEAKYLPLENQAQLTSLQKTIPLLKVDLKRLVSQLVILNDILGRDQLKRYLLVFQNSNEMRATGGFMGSLSFLDFNKAKISNLEMFANGSYTWQGQLTEFVKPPYPYSFFGPRWELHDANWFPDFPTSARKISWFLEKSGGPSFDGVIAINSDFLKELLTLIGPVELSEYNLTLDANNVIDLLQQQIAQDRQTELLSGPKRILNTLMPKLLEKVLNDQADYLKLTELALNSLKKKNILLSFKDASTAAWARNYHYDGAIENPKGDYLHLNYTNILSQKSDQVITQTIKDKVTLKKDGEVWHQLEINRTHHGKTGDPQVDVDNLSYLRVLLPTGSKFVNLVADLYQPSERVNQMHFKLDQDLNSNEQQVYKNSQGIRFSTQFNKTSLGFFQQLSPGETKKIILQYKLQNPATDRYSLFLQKQPGLKVKSLEVEVSLPVGSKIIKSMAVNNDKLRLEKNKVFYSSSWQEDEMLGVEWSL